MTVTVPENRSTRGGRRLQLSVILVPAGNPKARGAPIAILPGGPGGEITGQAAAWSRFLREVRGDHPLLFMDPRGTGGSNALDCEFTNPERMSGHVRDFLPPDDVRRCRQALSARADLTQYTSEQVAQDVDDVRAALGFERLIPYGTSGGTRLSLMYLKRFPERVEAMILAGMVPLSFRMPMHYAPDTDAAFDSLVAACNAEDRCARAYPRLRQRTDSLLRALARRPVVVALPFVEGPDSARVTTGIFAERLRTLMYNTETAASIPYIVDRAAKGEFQPFVSSLVAANRRQGRTISMGHFLSATCSEDVPRVHVDSARAMARGTILGTYRVDQQLGACRTWPRNQLPDDHFLPVRSNVPVLFISGDADPVTPPYWADAAGADLPNSAHAVFRGAAHGPVATPCATSLVARFLATRAPGRLDLSCASVNHRPEFQIR